ncbi:hypothetical protein M409DRAFT_61207 [Zasmidium cellare ATCC 36951]|uniref:Uncharacterized protein n=1 Tax=Zasmidium cellare ATCC 36951 TaxID=1080233 RepID=A0A6A6BZR3_ZASCE|nr:uncharacterized protein M409DRAFT_61207 [Zasmidium cellare ATCC 36951]KAF2158936.1 hypothetical protein M409DRAFT_61207 [Zasmidium cellare ATCC 36951]
MSSFLPCGDGIDFNVWQTQLDRIFVPRSKYPILRLIGPENVVNLHLEMPDPGDVAELRCTTAPLPADIHGLEMNETSHAHCFADVYMFLKQQGLEKWRLPRAASETISFQAKFWMYSIITCLASARGAFFLQIAVTQEPPLASLWTRLYPHIPCPQEALRESMRSVAMHVEEEAATLDMAWSLFVSWREAFAQYWIHDVRFDDRTKQPSNTAMRQGRVTLSGMEAHTAIVERMNAHIRAERSP